MELPKLPVTNVVVDGLWEEQYGPYTAEQVQELMRQAVLIEREACQRAIEYLDAGMWSCDINGAPVDAYIPKWKALEVIRSRDPT